jgi:hypothetical protein
MAATENFISDPIGFASRFAILVDERQIDHMQQQLLGLVNGPHALDPAACMCCFTVEYWNGTGARLILSPSKGYPCYFLPYKPDCSVTLDVGGLADWAFTSTLTGCSVQVHGPLATPTMTHSNARDVYTRALGATKTAAQDVIASAAGQAHMNAMLPPAVGQVGWVRKADYIGRVTAGNLAAAEGTFKKKSHHTITGFGASMYQGFKPEGGAFVWGQRTAGNWAFSFQATVGVVGTRNTGRLGFGVKHKALINQEAVLGAATRFYP